MQEARVAQDDLADVATNSYPLAKNPRDIQPNNATTTSTLPLFPRWPSTTRREEEAGACHLFLVHVMLNQWHGRIV